ncbi:hypothetical protein ACTXT7_011529 [Hymenolepis weldensis]
MVFGVVVVVSSEGHIITPPLLPQGLRVSGDANAYVGTLQTIVVKSPWIDNVANGGRPHVFQQGSATFHKPLKTHDWMAEIFQHHRTVVKTLTRQRLHFWDCAK